MALARHRGVSASHPKRQRKTPSDVVFEVVLTAIIVVILLAILYPLWFVIVASFSDPAAVATGQVTLLPKGFSLGGYAKILTDTRIWIGYRNTIIYTLLGTAA